MIMQLLLHNIQYAPVIITVSKLVCNRNYIRDIKLDINNICYCVFLYFLVIFPSFHMIRMGVFCNKSLINNTNNNDDDKQNPRAG